MSDDKNKIVVCTDFSSIAQHAFEESIPLAKHLNADIYLVHVFEDKRDTSVTAEKRLSKIVEKEQERLEDIEVHYRVADNTDGIVDSLNTVVAEIKPNYFIVGYELKSGMDRFFGPNVMKIARGTRFPVIAIKEDETLRDLKTIVFPLNMWEYARQKTRATIRLAKDFNAEIKLIALSVNLTKEDKRQLKIHTQNTVKRFEEYGVPYSVEELEGENEVDLVVNYANEIDADIISKVFHHNPSLISKLMGDQDEETLAKTNMPLFIVKSMDYMDSETWSPMRF